MTFRSARMMMVPVLLLAAFSAVAAEPAITELGVDQVTQKHGPRLLGSVVNRSSDGAVTIAVSREWLKGAQPRYFAAAVADEAVERRAALEDLQKRLAQWSAERPEPKTLAFFLKKESERVARELAVDEGARGADSEPEFLLLTVPAERVERVFIQPPSRKQAALVAWRERLPRVEQRSAASLLKELERLGIAVADQRVDLADRVAIRRQSDDEWSVRQAIVEYQYRQPIDFQGTGDVVVRTGEGAAAPATGELLVSILRSQLEGQLAELLNDPVPNKAKGKGSSEAWLKGAIAVAEGADARGFRVTRVAPEPASGKVSVETRFVARLSGGKWSTVWRHEEQADAARADPDAVDRIARDPQVKRSLELIKSTGLVGGDEAFQQALRFGAATMQAQQSADARFGDFRDRHVDRLDGPPLVLPGSGP